MSSFGTHAKYFQSVQFSGPKYILQFALEMISTQCTEVRFASFQSGGFIIAIVVNPPERKLTKRTSVQCVIM